MAKMMIFVYIVAALSFVPSEGRRLVQGNLIWRHGDRSSKNTYPNDPYKHVWKDGIMQLTSQGMAQEYDLGLFLRSKYGHLLSKKYRRGEIFIRSTDTDRSLMSAQCVAAGLYADKSVTKWEGTNSSWRPFPVHNEACERDWLKRVLQDPEKGCPAFDNLLNLAKKNSEFYQNLEKTYASFHKKLTSRTGAAQPYTIENVTEIYDNLFCLRANGYLLPDWVDNRTMATLRLLAGLSQGFQFSDYEMEYTKRLSKMRSGVILQKMVDNMRNRVSGRNNYSFVGYSAHDSKVAPLLLSMGSFNWIKPPYASCVMIDLLKDDDGSYHVEFSYRNDSKHEPYRLSFYECGTGCSWEKFQQVASTVMTDSNTPTLCGIEDENYCCGYLVVGVIVFILTGILFLVVRCVMKKLPRDRKARYHMLTKMEVD